jgi:RND family efflux transporter MFP subunit
VIKNNSENIKTLIKPAAFADSQPLFAKISNISSLIDPKSRTFTLELTVDNADGLLRPGMYTTVEVVLMQQQDTLLIPASALIQKDDKSFVYLAQHNSPARAVLTEIETGIITSDRVEVLSGLDSSSIIIYEGNAFLEDGQLISIVEDR